MILYPSELKGSVSIPPSKSDAQRAILLAALAQGTSQIINPGESNDVLGMLRNIEILGAKVEKSGNEYKIFGTPNIPKETVIIAGESGLGFRLLASLLALHGGNHTLIAEGSLQNRPMGFLANHFESDSLHIEGLLPPIRISGQSIKNEFHIDGTEGSQFISGMLIALPLLPFDSRITLSNPKSKPYIAMTLSSVSRFGGVVSNKDFVQFSIGGKQQYTAVRYEVEKDWSCAGYWLLAGALGHDIKISGLQMNSLQADKALLNVLISAGCTLQNNEGNISVLRKNLQTFEFDANDCPDLIPTLSVLAAVIDGESKIFGLNRLSSKESDRGKAIKEELEKTGVRVDLDYEKDCLTISGRTDAQGADFFAHNDHRMAMSLAIYSTVLSSKSHLKDWESVRKSYPNFWEDFKACFGKFSLI